MTNVTNFERVRGVQLDVSPKWWTEAHPISGSAARTYAIQIALRALGEIPAIEVHASAATLLLVVPANALETENEFAILADVVAAEIEAGIELEESDKVAPRGQSRWATRSAGPMSRAELEAKLVEGGFVVAGGGDERTDLWTHPQIAFYVALPAGGVDSDSVEYGSAAAGVAGETTTYRKMAHMLDQLAHANASHQAAMPGSVFGGDVLSDGGR